MERQISIRKNGLIEVSKAAEYSMSKEGLYQYIKNKECEKVGPGLYIPADEFADELLVLHKRCPNGVISHDEALYHYGLTDREPMVHTITVYSGYNTARLTASGYKVFYVDKTLLPLGRQMVVDQFGNEIPMYDLERTIVDLVRSRRKFEVQDFNTAIKTYARLPQKNLAKLTEYAKAFHVEKILRGYLEVLL